MSLFKRRDARTAGRDSVTRRFLVGGIGAVAAGLFPRRAGAADRGEARTVALQGDGNQPVDPRTLWEGGLERLAGRYVFHQIASPGGLWEHTDRKDGTRTQRQVSINEIPADFREKLQKAELIISDLKLPTMVQGDARKSPSGRGVLRFYAETSPGRLQVRNIPGASLDEQGSLNFDGPVTYRLEHQSHSNPSVGGVLIVRQNSERTWGAATLDFADLNATALPAKDKPDTDPATILANVRVLRSAVEAFAFVEWTVQDADPPRKYLGSVRLAKVGVLTQAPEKSA